MIIFLYVQEERGKIKHVNMNNIKKNELPHVETIIFDVKQNKTLVCINLRVDASEGKK